MKQASFLLLIVVALLSPACKKGEQGDMGPQGPQGNANVHTHFCTWVSSQFGMEGTGEHRVYDCTAPIITQDIIDNGAVLGYLKSSATGWRQLPFTAVVSANANSTREFQAIISDGNYRIRVSELGGNGDLTDSELDLFNGGNFELKVVTIAGSALLLPEEIEALVMGALAE